jgi:hypothetical protein
MNPTDAQIVRVYTQVTPPGGGAGVADASPNFIGPGPLAPTFDVVVEAEAGAILAFSSQPYSLVLYAYDVTQGVRVFPMDVPLGSIFGPPSWPSFQQVTTIPLSGVPYIPGHVYKYTAALTSAGLNAIASFMDSPLFILY